MQVAQQEQEQANVPRATEGRYLVNLDLVETADADRIRLFNSLDENQRSDMGQYGTPPPVACLMAAMFAEAPDRVNILDAGAGVGTLTSALVAEFLSRTKKPEVIHLTAVESEPVLLPALHETLERCRGRCLASEVECTFEVVSEDFIEYVVRAEADLFGSRTKRFDCAILNPPYRKIRSSSKHRSLLREMRIEVSNIYAAFVALTTRVLAPEGQLVAITPRSFCNGPYFSNDETESLLVPAGTYVLTKRFSAKEQRRRIDAYIYEAKHVFDGPVGFENHVNYIHAGGCGLDPVLARGLFVYLNSTLVDMYFRLFSGHTQVNATDIRNMPFPKADALRQVGRRVSSPKINQDDIDALFEELMATKNRSSSDPVASIKRVGEARSILEGPDVHAQGEVRPVP